MPNFEKPLQQFTEEELQQRVNQWDPKFGALGLYELQRRQQEKNSTQISELIREVKELKNITDKNSETATKNASSSNRLARWAIIIATLTLVVQVIFSVHQEKRCDAASAVDDQGYIKHWGCYYLIDLGFFGIHPIPISDYKERVYEK